MEIRDEQPPNETGARADPTSLSLDNPVLLAMMPIAARPAISAIWGFDRAMAAIVARARGSEAILAQLRLAWWRDEIGELSVHRARPDPLLWALANRVPEECHSGLATVVDAWEALLLAEHFGVAEAIAHATRRGAALWALSAAILDGDDVGTTRNGQGDGWAATDIATNIEDKDIREALFEYTARAARVARAAPRALRALDGWSLRIAARRGKPAPLRDQLYLLRIGLIGR